MLLMYWYPMSTGGRRSVAMSMTPGGSHSALDPGVGLALVVLFCGSAIFTLASPTQGASHHGSPRRVAGSGTGPRGRPFRRRSRGPGDWDLDSPPPPPRAGRCRARRDVRRDGLHAGVDALNGSDAPRRSRRIHGHGRNVIGRRALRQPPLLLRPLLVHGLPVRGGQARHARAPGHGGPVDLGHRRGDRPGGQCGAAPVRVHDARHRARSAGDEGVSVPA